MSLATSIKLEFKQIKRDPMLPWMMLFPLVIAMAIRFGLPGLQQWVLAQYQIDIMQYAPLMQSVLVLMSPLVIGMIIGFLLLDQKDENSLSAIALTPASLVGYLFKKMALPLILSIPVTILSLWITQLIPFVFGRALFVAILALPLAPCFGLFLAVFADNKVQGLALSKISGLFIVPPIFGWIYQDGLGWLSGLMPTYWVCHVFWHFEESISVSLLIALAYPSLIVLFLLKRFMNQQR